MKWFETVLDENVQNRPFLWIKIVQYLIWKLWSVLFAARNLRAWQQSYYVPLPSQKLAFYMKKVANVLLPPWLGSLCNHTPDLWGVQWGTPWVPVGCPGVKSKLSQIENFYPWKFLHMLQWRHESPHNHTPDLLGAQWGTLGVPVGCPGVKSKLSQIEHFYQWKLLHMR